MTFRLVSINIPGKDKQGLGILSVVIKPFGRFFICEQLRESGDLYTRASLHE